MATTSAAFVVLRFSFAGLDYYRKDDLSEEEKLEFQPTTDNEDLLIVEALKQLHAKAFYHEMNYDDVCTKS